MKLLKNCYQIVSGYEGGLRRKVFFTWFKLLIQNRFLATSSPGQVYMFGKSFQYSSRGSLYGMFNEIFIEQNYYVAPTLLPLTILDCGSNVGMSVLYFSTVAPQAKIVAFEPNPHTFALLKKNIEERHFTVKLEPVGLGAVAGKALMQTDENEYASQSASVTGHLESKQKTLHGVEVEIKPLSQYITGPVDILKMDIEGLEGEVINELFQSNKLALVKKLFIEYHFDGVHTTYPLGKMLSDIEKAGFQYVIHSGIQFPFTATQKKHSKNISYKITGWKDIDKQGN